MFRRAADADTLRRQALIDDAASLMLLPRDAPIRYAAIIDADADAADADAAAIIDAFDAAIFFSHAP